MEILFIEALIALNVAFLRHSFNGYTILLKAIWLKSFFTFVTPKIRCLNEIGFSLVRKLAFWSVYTACEHLQYVREISPSKSNTASGTKNIGLLLKRFLKIYSHYCSCTFDVMKKLTLICKTLGRNESIVEHGNNSLFTASSCLF